MIFSVLEWDLGCSLDFKADAVQSYRAGSLEVDRHSQINGRSKKIRG